MTVLILTIVSYVRIRQVHLKNKIQSVFEMLVTMLSSTRSLLISFCQYLKFYIILVNFMISTSTIYLMVDYYDGEGERTLTDKSLLRSFSHLLNNSSVSKLQTPFTT